MPVIIDGNNLLHSLPTPERNRADVRRRALDQVRHEAMQVFLVFDGPPPVGSPVQEHLGRAHGAILRRRQRRRSSSSNWFPRPADLHRSGWWSLMIVRFATEPAARAPLFGRWPSGAPRPPKATVAYESKLSSHDIADWENYFSTAGESEDS